MPKNDIKKAALYIRVSTDMQADKDSLPLQESDLRKLADLNGITETVLFKDAGYSGKNLNRPAFQDMIARMRKGEFSHLYVWRLDRISRNLVDFVGLYDELKRLNVAFVSKCETFDSSTAGGEAMLKILLVFAEMERKTIAERVTAVMLGRAKEGKWNGGRPPFGYMLENGARAAEKKFPVPDPVEAPLVKLIFETYAKEKSLKATARILNNAGIKTRNGRKWSNNTILVIIRNEFYKGVYIYNRHDSNQSKDKFIRDSLDWVKVEGNHVPIIDAELWDKCNNIRANNRTFTPSVGQRITNQDKYIFGGLLACSTCGYTLTPQDRYKDKQAEKQTSYYTCHAKYKDYNQCSGSARISDRVLLPRLMGFISRIISACGRAEQFASSEQLTAYLLHDNLLPEAKTIKEAKQVYIAIRGHVKHIYGIDNKESADPNQALIENTKQELEKYNKALEKLRKAYLFDAGDMSEAEYFDQKKQLTAKTEELQKQIERLSGLDPATDEAYISQLAQLLFIKKLQNTSSDFNYYALAGAVGRSVVRAFIQSIIDKVYIDKKNISKIIFKNGQTITIEY